MEYKSNKAAVMFALKEAKKEFCEGVGVLCVGEVQSITPVLTGNLKKCITSEVMPSNEGVSIGVTKEAPYGIFVEQGTSMQTAQPYLQPGCMNALPKIINVAEQLYKAKLGGE